jgi:membrane-associated HD superfamily phosphohydrolase
MLTPTQATSTGFTRGDARRLVVAAGILIVALTAILAIDLLPERPLEVKVGQLATRDIVATKSTDYESAIETKAAREAASAAVPFQYTFTSENAIATAEEQQVAFENRVQRIDAVFITDLSAATRAALLETAVTDLSDGARTTLKGLAPSRWAAVRTEAARVLDAIERTELRDTEVAETRARLAGTMAGGINEQERMLAAELIAPLIVPNSSFSEDLTSTARTKAADAVEPVVVHIALGEVIARTGDVINGTEIEKIEAVGLAVPSESVASE